MNTLYPMGFFSWKTMDTDESIPNNDSALNTFTVYMQDDKGNTWIEHDYEGYGVFGGKDYYELLSEMNGHGTDRSKGIEIAFHEHPSGDHNLGVLYPNLRRNNNRKYVPTGPESCEHQGFFYEEEEEE